MGEVETLTCDGMGVSVEETPDALTYTFAPQRHGPVPPAPVGFLFVLVLCPLGYLALVVYARAKAGARPDWEDFLTGVFAGQMIAWFVTGAVLSGRLLRGAARPSRIALEFTRTDVRHGGAAVCELERVRGLRLFVYTSTPRLLADVPLPRTESPPAPGLVPLPPEFAPVAAGERPPAETEACLSLVIGEELFPAKSEGSGGTHGLFGGFAAGELRALAEHLHRRLAAFRFNQGVADPLDAFSVVETTGDEAAKLMHTRPGTGSRGRFDRAVLSLLRYRRFGIAWSVTMLAGLYATARLIPAAGLAPSLVLPHCALGLFTVGLLILQVSPEVETPSGAG
jgi:hypothetical protein